MYIYIYVWFLDSILFAADSLETWARPGDPGEGL
jgi:hypothetical protein